MENNKRVALVEVCFTMMGDSILRVVWDGHEFELDEAVRVAKRQTKERWSCVMVAISVHSVKEVYRKKGYKLDFPAQAVANVQRNLAKLGA